MHVQVRFHDEKEQVTVTTEKLAAVFEPVLALVSKPVNLLLGLIPEEYRHAIKFIMSSLLSFFIDYTGRIIFGIWMSGTLANVLARFISAPVNFFVNQKAVFKGDESTLKAAVKYALLALVILAGDTFVNEFLMVNTLRIPVAIAKPITETIMFCFSYVVQKVFVYRKQK